LYYLEIKENDASLYARPSKRSRVIRVSKQSPLVIEVLTELPWADILLFLKDSIDLITDTSELIFTIQWIYKKHSSQSKDDDFHKRNPDLPKGKQADSVRNIVRRHKNTLKKIRKIETK
jgi:hypothetical protein